MSTITIADKIDLPATYRAGQMYKNCESGDIYLLCNIGTWRLVCLNGHGYWGRGADEACNAFEGRRDDFDLITAPVTITP